MPLKDPEGFTFVPLYSKKTFLNDKFTITGKDRTGLISPLAMEEHRSCLDRRGFYRVSHGGFDTGERSS